MDTLSSIRKARRAVDSLKKAELRKLRNQYDPLSTSTTRTTSEMPSPHDTRYTSQHEVTLNDISQELTEQVRFRPDTLRKRFVRRTSRADRIVSHVVCGEVRETWNHKLHANEQLTDESRQKLLNMSAAQRSPYNKRVTIQDVTNEKREKRLSALAEWMVFQWCDAEGYDPTKHSASISKHLIQQCIKTSCTCVHVF